MFRKKTGVEFRYDFTDYEELKKEVNSQIAQALRRNPYEMVSSQKELEGNFKFKRDLRKAIKGGMVGEQNAKVFVCDFIKELLVVKMHVTEEQLNYILPFMSPYSIAVKDKFFIMVYYYEKLYGDDGFQVLMGRYQFACPKENEEGEIYYEISEVDIHEAYQEEGGIPLTYVDKLNIVAQKIYEDTRGNGPIDRLFYLPVDGISGGVSGTAFTGVEFLSEEEVYSYQSIWIFYQGKSIYLSFLSFGSWKEFVRVCKNIYRYQSPGQLSQRKGYIVNEMADGSRVAVARPPFCESWVFFIRKFNSVTKKNMDDLLTDDNKQLPIKLIRWLIRGCQNIAITGEQGSGKTTLLMSMIGFIRPTYNLRIQEMAFELHLRKLFPRRNIVSFRETNSISGQQGLDFQKKTDGTVNILGEVASNEVCSWMVQMAQVASNFTLFTHHAKTTEDLLYAFRNALLMEGGFRDEKIALEQVLHVIRFDVHMKKAEDGHRYIERITEVALKDMNCNGTLRDMFETRNLVVYTKDGYRVTDVMSEAVQRSILAELEVGEKQEFLEFLREWREQIDA